MVCRLANRSTYSRIVLERLARSPRRRRDTPSARARPSRRRHSAARPGRSPPARVVASSISCVVRQRPEVVAVGAEVLEAQARLRLIRHHVRTPVLEVLDAADLARRIVNVDPVVREQVGAIDDHADGDEVAVLEIARRRCTTARRLRAQARHQMRQRHRRDDVRAPAGRSRRRRDSISTPRNGVAVVRDGRDARVQQDRSAELLDPLPQTLPTSCPGPGADIRIRRSAS